MNSGEASSFSITASRFTRTGRVSARKVRTSSALGGRPARSSETRRKKSASLHNSDGAIFMRCHFEATSSSMRPHVSGCCQTKPLRSPITVSVVAA